MKYIYDETLEQMISSFEKIGQKKFRATQVFEWLYKKQVSSFDEMSNLSNELREELKKHYSFQVLSIKDKQVSRDGTTKYLFELNDGGLIETVLMRFHYGNSVCVSTQLGCNMGCVFCASGILKKQRNLTAGEIVAQIMMIEKDLKDDRVSHIVVMGTGEPFDNYENVNEFIHIVNAPKGLAIGARHITISTCGLVPQIEKYANNGLQTNLAISLHAPNNEIRDQLIPVNKTYPMEELRAAVKGYIDKTNRRVTFEYILLEDINDSLVYARQLAHYLRGLNAYVNLIPYNKVSDFGFKPSTRLQVEAFKEELLRLRINVTLRKEQGADILAACGQLRVEHTVKE